MNIARLLTQSGRSKAGFLSDQAELKNSLFVGVCETWLSPDIADAEVCYNFPGYSVFRSDRIGRQGGGVALYLSDSLSGDVIASFDNGVCQALVVMIHQINSCICVCYRPPDTRMSEFSEMLQGVDSALSSLPDPTPNIVIMGDLNFPRSCIHWQVSDEGHLFPLVANHRQEETSQGKQDRLQAQKLVDLAAKHCLLQVVEGATHGVECLDLIWTNNWDLVSSCNLDTFSQFSDHKMVTASTTFKINQKEALLEEQFLCSTGKRYKSFDFSKAPWPLIEQQLGEIDWQPMQVSSKDSPEEALAWFHDKVLEVLENHVPKKENKRTGRKPKMHRQRKLLWRKLSKVDQRLKSAATMQKKAKILQQKWALERKKMFGSPIINNLVYQ